MEQTKVFLVEQWDATSRRWVTPKSVSFPREYDFNDRKLMDRVHKWAEERSKSHRGEKFRLVLRTTTVEDTVVIPRLTVTVRGLMGDPVL